MRADREDIRPAANEQDFIIADMADELPAVGKRRFGNAVRQVGTVWIGLILGHARAPVDRSDRID